MNRRFTLLKALSAILLFLGIALGQSAFAQTTWTLQPTSSGNTITYKVKRSGDISKAVTVRYRTIGLSSYEGQHFDAANGTLNFPAGIDEKTVSVTTKDPTTEVYQYYKSGTQKKYLFEVTDMGGFSLVSREDNASTGTVFNTAYLNQSVTNLVYFNGTNYASAMSTSKYKDVSYTPPTSQVETSGTLDGYVLIDDSYEYEQKSATVSTSNIINTTNATGSYLKSMGCKIYATVCFTEKERDDGYQYIQILAGNSSASYDGADPNAGVDAPVNSAYKVCFELSDGSNAEGKQFFPHRYNYANKTEETNAGISITEFSQTNGHLWQQKFKSGYQASNSGSVVFDANVSNITTRFDAGGDNNDTWGYKNLFVRMALCDATAPTILALNSIKVADGAYGYGNTVYITVPFKEIVTVTGSPTLSTTWGTLDYIAGSGTNVLTFSGHIEADLGTVLTVNSISGTSYTIRDLMGNTYNSTNINKTFSNLTVTNPWAGSGTASDPYIIMDRYQLDLLSHQVWAGNYYDGKYFKLGTDITYSHPNADTWDKTTSFDSNFTSIGGWGKSFRGIFDGDGHSISGIRIYKTGSANTDECQGLFGLTYSGSMVKNLVLYDINIVGKNQVGVVVGSAGGTIQDCYIYNARAQAAIGSSCGIINGSGTSTITRAYYKDCMVGSNTGQHNIVKLTLNDNATVTRTPVTTLNGNTALHNDGLTLSGAEYYTPNIDIALGYSGSVSSGYFVKYTASTSNGDITTSHINNGNVLTMPDADVTVNATLMPVVTYLDANGIAQQCSDYSVITGSDSDVNLGASGKTHWYVVNSNATINAKLYFHGNTNLILCDGATLTVNRNGTAVIANEFDNFNIFGQTNGNGTLNAASLNNSGITSRHLGIYGGIVSASAPNGGIHAGAYSITLGYTTPANRFTASSYYCSSLIVKSGQTLTDGEGLLYSGTYTGDGLDATLAALAGKTLQPAYSLVVPTNFSVTGITAPQGFAPAGETVTLHTAEGYTITAASYTPEGGSATDITPVEGVWSFTMPAANTMVNATRSVNTYTVHFDANATNGINATGTMTDQTFTYDEAQSLTANTFARTGYTFNGWNTAADGTGTAYTNQQSVNNLTNVLNGVVTLYAQWNVIGWDGAGTSENDPYLIIYASQLVKLADDVNSGEKYWHKYFKLGNDIDMNGVAFEGIGSIFNQFSGYFNGDNRTISNLTINSQEGNIGLFVYMTGSVSNLILSGANITGRYEIGGIAGRTSGSSSISNCLVLNSNITKTGIGSIDAGVIVGNNNTNAVLTNNHYRNCSVTQGENTYTTNIGTPNGDVAGARSIHTLALPEHVTATSTDMLTYDNVTYYASNVEVTLTPASGITLADVSVNGVAATHQQDETWTFTMPAADATVTCTSSVPYIDANGTQQTCSNFTTIESSQYTYGTNGQECWFVVSGDVTINGIFLKGTISHLILCDGATLTINQTNDNDGLQTSDNLIIYGQSVGNGTLTVSAPWIGLSTNNDLIINGGIISATSTTTSGITAGLGNITINRGSVTARGYYGGIYGQNIFINGGIVNATNGEGSNSYGIIADLDITLGYTELTDRITSSSYKSYDGTVSVKAGQFLTDGTTAAYIGTLNNDQISALAGQTLQPCFSITLPEHVVATGVISQEGTTAYALAGNEITLVVTEGYEITSGSASFTMPTHNVVSDVTVQAITYSISYDLAGGSVATANPTTYTITTPSFTLNNPTREGYTFAGWTGTDLTGATSNVTIAQGSTGDRSYTATWNVITYNITYDLAGGSVATANPTTYTIESPSFTLTNPTREGYEFAGWTGTGLTEATENVTIAQGSMGDREYTATWNIVTYNITYDLAGGSVATANPTTYTITTPSFTLNNPTREGYTFTGWTGTGLTEATSNVTIAQGSTGDRSYTATWRQQIAYIDADGTQQTCSSYTVIESSNSSVALGTVGQDGWYVVSGNVTITGQLWLKGTNNHLILCDGASLTISHAMQNADGIYVRNNLYIYGQSAGSGTATITITSPGVNGINTLNGSITINGGIISANSDNYGINTIGGSITINRGSVTAQGNYDGIRSEQSITINGGTVTATASTGNYSRGISANNVTINGGIVSATGPQYGIYANGITVGWTNLTDRITANRYNNNVTIKEGQSFTDGTALYTGSASNTAIAGKTLQPAFTLTYDLAGGSVATANPTFYTYESPDITLNNPTREGYTFTGWTGTDLTEPTQNVTITHGSTGHRSYTATWNILTYNITYDLAGGSVATANPATYTIESADITLNNPTREGYTFAGWTGTDLTEATEYVTIVQGSTGDRSYTATWTQLPVTYIDADGTQQTCSSYTIIESSNSTVYLGTYGQDCWYVVNGDVTINDQLQLQGSNNHLILCDGATLNITSTNYMAINVYGGSSTGSLTIYRQALGSGTIEIDASGSRGISTQTGLTINGGNITINAKTDGIRNVEGAVTINGGTVDVTSTNSDGISTSGSGNIIIINGGIVKATAPESHLGIRANGGNVVLGFTNVTDRITVSKYGGSNVTFSVKANQVLYDGTTAYSGNLTWNQINALAGKTLQPCYIITLPLNVTATGVISQENTTAYAIAGATVTLASAVQDKPLLNVTVNGNAATHNSDGTWSFEMPASNVTVNGTIAPWDGAGTAQSPYIITSTTELDMLASLVNGGERFDGTYFELGNNISYDHQTDWDDATSTESNYTTIGYNHPFWGSFDGKGYTVSGIRIYNEQGSYHGLFGMLQGGEYTHGEVKNVTLTDARFTDSNNNSYYQLGGIAGTAFPGPNYASIVNCHVSNTVAIHIISDNSVAYYGGIAGNLTQGCTISGCTSGVTITVGNGNNNDKKEYGGIVGNSTGTIQNCLASGASLPDLYYSGAIVGMGSGGTLVDNYYSHCHLGERNHEIGIGRFYQYTACDVDGARIVSIPYIDADGNQQLCTNYTPLDGGGYKTYGEADVEAWYVVDHDVTYTDDVSFYGSANLILVDGATLTLNPDDPAYGQTMSTSDNFNIYVQSTGTGAITATDANIGAGDNLTIYGGHISLTSVAFDACYLYSSDDLTINGGQISIESNERCIRTYSGGKLTINGGTLNAVTTEENNSSGYSVVDCGYYGDVVINGGNITLTNDGDGDGITADNVTINGGNVSIHIKNTSSRDGINVGGGTITLGWTDASDRIMSEGGYNADQLNIATGQAFTDGEGNYYAGTLNWDEIEALAGKTLRPFTNFDETFHITYVTNGGTLPEGYPTTYTFGETVVLPVPTKEDNTFVGWFENSFFYSDPVTEIVAGTALGDKTFYAKWMPAKTWVEYLDADGQQQRVYATVLYGIETELPGGVYTIVDDEVNFDKLSFTGTTTIILPDNKYLYVECMGKGTNDDEYSLFVNGDLTIYGQEHGDGVFGSYNVQVLGDVAIYGGYHNIGQLSANNGSSTITLSWTGWNSSIRVGVYLGKVVLAKAFIDDDDNIHEAGTVADVNTINGQYLYPFITETEVSYLDENGVLQTVTATVLYGGEEAEYPGGVYTVLDMVIRGQAYYDRLHFTGDATIIIPDWCSLGVAAAKEDNEYWLHVDGNLTIYGQEYGNGQCYFSNVTVNGHVNVYGGWVVLYNISANVINLSWTSVQNEHMVIPTQGTTVNLLKDFIYYLDDYNHHVINAQQGVDIATIAGRYLKPYAETIDVSYIDENGDTHTENATVLFGDETDLNGGTYTIIDDISFSHAVSFSGDTKLIIPDGTYFYGYTQDNSFFEGEVINVNVSGDLAIYGQENRSGTVLYINASVSDAVTVSNVSVINSFINSESDILIAGGEHEYGQLSANGTITLGYLTFNDEIYCEDYEGTVAIRAGQTMMINNNGNEKTYTGPLTSNQVAEIESQYLKPYQTSITLDVAGYGESTESDHWVFIASPIAGSISADKVTNLIGGMTPSGQYDFDLYRFNQSASLEWENYHQHNTTANPFVLENGKGYLYASKEDVTLAFPGAVYLAASKEVALDYDANAELAGWNLVGNPFNAPATVNKSYYRMNSTGTGLVAEAVSGSTSIPAFTGVMVQATDVEQTVIFTKTTGTKGYQETGLGTLQIALTQAGARGNAVLDNAIVSFNEGDELGKFYFGYQDANIYIPVGHDEYAIVCIGRDGVHTVSTNEIPVNFKAHKNGEYTLTVSAPLTSHLSPLTLIDNLTGANIDLLQTPSYSFTAHTSDYASRFKLVFGEGAADDDDDFAFIDGNGNLIINGDGIVQIIDMMGHVLVTRNAKDRIGTEGLAVGVYVLKLINGENVKTQKIVVR